MGLLRTASRAAVASSVHGRVQRRQQERWAGEAAAAAAAAAPPQAEPADPRTALMSGLTDLRAAGVVTDEEFAAISSRIFS